MVAYFLGEPGFEEAERASERLGHQDFEGALPYLKLAAAKGSIYGKSWLGLYYMGGGLGADRCGEGEEMLAQACAAPKGAYACDTLADFYANPTNRRDACVRRDILKAYWYYAQSNALWPDHNTKNILGKLRQMMSPQLIQIANSLDQKAALRTAASDERASTPTPDQLERYYAVYRQEEVLFLRRVLTDYANGTDDENHQLEGWEREYCKSKFIVVYFAEDSLLGGYNIDIMFQNRPDRLFHAWVFDGADGYLSLRVFKDSKLSPSKLRNLQESSKQWLADREHAL